MRLLAAALAVMVALLGAQASRADEAANISWRGAYINAAAERPMATFSAEPQSTIPPPLAVITSSLQGVGVGLRAGYDLQWNELVAGALVEGSFSNATASGSFSPSPGITQDDALAMNWEGSLRARLGLAGGPLLVYGTLGAAITDASVTDWTLRSTNYGPFPFNGLGLVYGGGLEYRIKDKWSLSVDYSHYDFAMNQPAQIIFAPGSNGARDTFSADIFKFGMTYHL